MHRNAIRAGLAIAIISLAACASTSQSERHAVTGSNIKAEQEGQVAGNARVYCRDAIERTGTQDVRSAVTRSASSARDCTD